MDSCWSCGNGHLFCSSLGVKRRFHRECWPVFIRVQWEAVWAVELVGGSSCLLSCCGPGLAVTVTGMPREETASHSLKQGSCVTAAESHYLSKQDSLIGKTDRSSLTPWGLWGQN